MANDKWNFARRGVIKLPFDLMRNHPQFFQRILSKVLVIEAQNYFHNMVVEYTCICPQFDEVHPYECTPEYRVEITGDNKVRFTPCGVRHEDLYRCLCKVADLKQADGKIGFKAGELSAIVNDVAAKVAEVQKGYFGYVDEP